MVDSVFIEIGKGIQANSNNWYRNIQLLGALFTGVNPHKATHNIYEPVQLDPLRTIPGEFGNRITLLLRRMLEIDPVSRPTAGELIDPFQQILFDAIKLATDLEGSAF
ncbi:MAG: hypothetical protein R3A44_32560 [Caldilineaceae bacterium]